MKYVSSSVFWGILRVSSLSSWTQMHREKMGWWWDEWCFFTVFYAIYLIGFHHLRWHGDWCWDSTTDSLQIFSRATSVKCQSNKHVMWYIKESQHTFTVNWLYIIQTWYIYNIYIYYMVHIQLQFTQMFSIRIIMNHVPRSDKEPSGGREHWILIWSIPSGAGRWLCHMSYFFSKH